MGRIEERKREREVCQEGRGIEKERDSIEKGRCMRDRRFSI